MLLAKNRKATFEHSILDKYTAGIVLTGYEVKAVREGKVNFDGAYVQVTRDGPIILNLHIGRYTNQSQELTDQDSRRTRKLLLQQREIDKITRDLKEKGHTAIPLALITSKNLIKLELATVKGKKKQEKKNVEKERQIARDLEVTRKSMGI